jgi:hypothetical protein
VGLIKTHIQALSFVAAGIGNGLFLMHMVGFYLWLLNMRAQKVDSGLLGLLRNSTGDRRPPGVIFLATHMFENASSGFEA